MDIIKDSITFCVNHEVMTRGLYIPDVKNLGDYDVYTIDMRLRQPYVDIPMTEIEAHSFEHNFATALREVGNSGEYCHDAEVLYFGPMGCMTGFYAVIAIRIGLTEEEVPNYLLDMLFKTCALMHLQRDIVAKNKTQCGNCFTLGNIEDIEPLLTDLESLILTCKESKSFNEYEFIKEV